MANSRASSDIRLLSSNSPSLPMLLALVQSYRIRWHVVLLVVLLYSIQDCWIAIVVSCLLLHHVLAEAST